MTKEDVLKIARLKRKLKSSDIVAAFKVSRQYASVLINSLVSEGKLLKVGSTNKAYYILPEYSRDSGAYPAKISKRLKNKKLAEHEIFNEIESQYPPIRQLPENVKSIIIYAFSEMLNNAIEHSKSADIEMEISVQNRKLTFIVNDFGIGVFRNVMKKKRLKDEIAAMQDLLKGKTTTMPKSHSGEGIFFTSKVADVFTLQSFGHLLVVNNKVHEVFFQRPPALKRGTKVKFTIDVNSSRHLNDVFKKFTTESEYGFNKTEVKVRLYALGGVHVSRSQARRILAGLNKFESITLDFDKVPMIGQAFADEVFRVFKRKHPNIKIQPINMDEGVKFMIERVAKDN
jgi:anti-sigma regulatory factor (Ser/Thr protein kinase)